MKKTAIVGLGETAFSPPGDVNTSSELWLACEAIRRAADDAGLNPTEIDGFVSFANSALDPAILQLELAMPELNFSSMVWGGRGGGACGALAHAAMAIEAKQAKYVAVFRSLSQTHTRRYGDFFSGRTHVNFTAPFGLLAPVQMNALVLQRYMHDYSLPEDAFSEVALVCRENAQYNPKAQTFGRPLNKTDYENSRIISSPLRIADCCLQSDGACAIIVTSRERAYDLPHKPVVVAAALQGSGPRWSSGSMGSHNMPRGEYTTGNGKILADKLFTAAQVQPKDISVAQIYDHFTGMVLIALEDYGFCERGGASAYANTGALRFGENVLPINTAGGSLGEAYVHGMNLVTEAARQIRGDSIRQVPHASLSFVCSGGGVAPTSAAILSD